MSLVICGSEAVVLTVYDEDGEKLCESQGTTVLESSRLSLSGIVEGETGDFADLNTRGTFLVVEEQQRRQGEQRNRR